MEQEDLDRWWSSLTIVEKERIAQKVSGHACPYPTCSETWNALGRERQTAVHTHCVERHGLVETPWREGDTFSY